MPDNTQTQTLISALRTLQESYDTLATALSAQATSAALDTAKLAIIAAIDAIDTSDLAKQGTNPNATLSEVQTQATSAASDAAAAKTAVQGITGYALQGTDQAATNTAILSAISNIPSPDLSTVAKQGTNPQANISRIQSLLENTIIPFSLGECVFSEEIIDCGQAMASRDKCVSLVSYAYTVAPQVRNMSEDKWTNIKTVTFYNATEVQSAKNTTFGYASPCETYEAPNATMIGGYATFYLYTELKKLDISRGYQFSSGSASFYELFTSCNKLIDIITGLNFHLSSSGFLSGIFAKWSPTEALRSDSISLLTNADITSGFTSNLEKLLYNIREHIAANLADITEQASKSITFSAAVKAAILADQPTADAFTNKGWTIA